MTDLTPQELIRLGLLSADGKLTAHELVRLGLVAPDGSIQSEELARQILLAPDGFVQTRETVRMILYSGTLLSTGVSMFEVIRLVLVNGITVVTSDNPGFCSIIW